MIYVSVVLFKSDFIHPSAIFGLLSSGVIAVST